MVNRVIPQLRISVLVIGAILACTQATWAAGDAREGRRVAKRWCSGCHVIGHSSRQRDTAPAFSVLANDPKKSAEYLKAWITNPHPPMPNFNLTRRTVDDLVAYIRSLHTAPKGIQKK